MTTVSARLKGRVVARRTLADQVYTSIKEAIFDGELKPGERLKELEIAGSLGASRTPVREALSRLQQEGLVQSLKTGGLTVVKLSEQDVVEIFGVIKVLEAYAARLAAEKATPRDIENLERLCESGGQLGGDHVDRLMELNRRFHEALTAISGHRYLQEIISQLRVAMRPYRALSLASPEYRRTSLAEHRQMIEALRNRDVERLVQIVNAHLDIAQQVTRASLGQHARQHAAER